MVLQGRVTVVNTSAADAGHHGRAPVQYGDTVVPASVAYEIEGTNSSPSLRVEFEIRDGQPVCVGLHMTASAGGRGLAQGDLDTLPNLKRLAEDSFFALAMRPATQPSGWHINPRDRERVRAARSDIRTRGDEELKTVAQVYRNHIDDRPAAAVEALGYTRRTAQRRIEQARQRGYLPATTRGKKRA